MTMTLQEYFDRTVEHLAKQKKQAINQSDIIPGDYTCVYLSKDGLKCAVGAHIPDGHAAQNFNGGIDSLAYQFPELRGVAWPDSLEGMNLAKSLQGAHDTSKNKGRLISSLGIVANKYNLDPKSIQLITKWKGRKSQ